MSQVAILIVAYNGELDLPACLRSVRDSMDGDVDKQIIVVDNASADGTQKLLAQEAGIQVVRCDTNLGFAGGNDRGWQYIKEHLPKCDFVFLLNQDTIVESRFLGRGA